MRAVTVAALIFSVQLQANAEPLWLVVGASDRSPTGIARKAEALSVHVPDGLVVQTSDCGDKPSVFAWVGATAASEGAARTALRRIRKVAADAYVKRCNVRPDTLLALRVNAVDPSIARVPDNAVNWQEVDRVSVVQPLPDGRSLIIDRYFAKVADDPLEGRRERVVLADRSGRRLILENDCVDPAGIRTQRTYIAFECVREQAGDHLLHSVVVFDGTGRKIIETQRCRDPKWAGERVIACDAESVGPDGRLKLQARHIGLNSGKDVL